ncbi:MAG: DEAD/DEAH box helicase [Rhodobacteraceae bacterium]|nr:DEAD/DEAH box helicase [Paracoccaceae bacterium]
MRRSFFPPKGALVKLQDGTPGIVRDLGSGVAPNAACLSLADNRRVWVALSDLNHAYEPGQHVRHRPPRAHGHSLGTGVVLATRTLGDSGQILVQFAETGEARWLDWRVLAHAVPVEFRIAQRQTSRHADHAERFRLRMLAKALRIWNANTGIFGRLDIDPLPHQLDVARKVVTSPQARWLIADDVGLGKTIEIGLILHALSQRNRCRRVLIVCPSSLTRQWKEEMRSKFGRVFDIYHSDFRPKYADEMRLRENVIISVDLAKRDGHSARLIEAGFWDVVVFDEAHRLGRSETGQQTARYALARRLQNHTHSLLLLTATPHQGKSRRFAALLELVRPDLLSEIRMLEIKPEVVGDIIIRNRKTRVTDAEGTLIFRGHDTLRYMVHPSPEMREADKALRCYLNKGYRASADAQDGMIGQAIGFVMTTYRKLASSSVAAIERALERRLERLQNGAVASRAIPFAEQIEDDDNLAETGPIGEVGAFFANEADEVRIILNLLRAARQSDAKLQTFLGKVVLPLLAKGRNLLVFTEYRATQAYVAAAITQACPGVHVTVLNGSMPLDEKTNNVRAFNSRKARVMVSTEAGGEGLNLHDSCYILVNYDLPWNPARLVQRIGRLYRYGQVRRVQVINLQSDDGFDDSAISLLLDRVSTIAQDMASVAGEKTRDALAAEILGELMSNIDMERILEQATSMRMEQTEEDITQAIKAAQKAQEAEDDILQFASACQTRISGGFDVRHMVSFVKGMAPMVGYDIRGERHGGKTLEIALASGDVGRWPEFGRRSIVRLTADHARAVADPTLVPMDFESVFVRDILDLATDHMRFGGLYAETETRIDAAEDVIAVYQVRWQGLSGELLEEELIALSGKPEGAGELPHEEFVNLLLRPMKSAAVSAPGGADRSTARGFAPAVEGLISRRAETDRMPSSVFLVAGLRTSPGVTASVEG